MTELTHERIVELERALRERARALRGEIRESLLRSEDARHKDLAGAVSDIGDESVADLLTDLDIAAVDRDVEELREVENALARVRWNAYGACADCGESIDPARLAAYPAAARCLACQDRHERSYAHRETPSL